MIKNNLRACQDLANAQISVNRAVWAMNEQLNRSSDAKKHGADITDEYIVRQINQAIEDLTLAVKGTTAQQSLADGYEDR